MVLLNQATAPEGMRIYAIGDVHGCLEALHEMHAAIGEDLARRPVSDWRLVHVGDYVDRGPDCRGVIDHLIRARAMDDRVICLRGNHDHMFLAGIRGDADLSQIWLRNGGGETLIDYGVEVAEFLDRLASGSPTIPDVPESHISFLESLPLTVRFGDYVFVHAGIDPDVPLDEQTEQSMLWIRDPFMKSTAEFDAVIVHGHTPVKRIDVQPNRIGIDTGAVFGRELTCLVLEGAGKAVLRDGGITELAKV